MCRLKPVVAWMLPGALPAGERCDVVVLAANAIDKLIADASAAGGP